MEGSNSKGLFTYIEAFPSYLRLTIVFHTYNNMDTNQQRAGNQQQNTTGRRLYYSPTMIMLYTLIPVTHLQIMYFEGHCSLFRTVCVCLSVPAVTACNATTTNSLYRLLSHVLLDFDSWICKLHVKLSILGGRFTPPPPLDETLSRY